MVSDASTAKPSWKARLIAFLDELGGDEAGIEAGEEAAVEPATVDEARAAEIDAAETVETEGEVEGGEPTEPGDGEPVESTPGSSESNEELDTLRAALTEQGALVETLRNTIAELGGVDPTEPIAAEIAEADDAPSEDDVVSDFDADYDRRKAALADLTKEN